MESSQTDLLYGVQRAQYSPTYCAFTDVTSLISIETLQVRRVKSIAPKPPSLATVDYQTRSLLLKVTEGNFDIFTSDFY